MFSTPEITNLDTDLGLELTTPDDHDYALCDLGGPVRSSVEALIIILFYSPS